MAQMAIEAGVQWLVLAPGISEAERREHYPTLVEMCREAAVFLTATADIAAAKEYGLHGVLIDGASEAPAKVREDLGPEAVIGVISDNPTIAPELERADIDYVQTRPSNIDTETIAAIRATGAKIPLVAYVADAQPDIVPELMAKGFSGVCCGASVFAHKDPTALLETILAATVG